jgi:hypothetical protein
VHPHKERATGPKAETAGGRAAVAILQPKSWGVLMLPETVMARLEAIPTLAASGKRVNGLHRLMGSRLLWEQGLKKIVSNRGAMTPGVDGETFADFGPEDLDPLIASVVAGAYKPKPVRRVFIPKGKGKRRPLGIPTRANSSKGSMSRCSRTPRMGSGRGDRVTRRLNTLKPSGRA